MSLEVIFILFWLYSILGWGVETIFVSIQNKKFVNRGFLLGPYCPIYGTGAVILLLLKKYQTDPLIVFVLSIFICSFVEYITSYIMEQIYRVRWWDYTNRMFDLNGRICLFNSICFGFLGMLMVCYINPFFISKINLLSKSFIDIIAIIIGIVTLFDIIITTSIMFDVRNTVINFKEKTFTNLFKPNTDNTEEISQRVRNILKEKSFVHKHLSKSYDNLKVYKNNFIQKTEDLMKLKRSQKLENIFVISIFISTLIGFILGKTFGNTGLFISVFVGINVFILYLISRRNNERK